MARKEPAKGLHTSPTSSGVQNMPDNVPEDDMRTMSQIMPVIKKGKELEKQYKGLWTEEEFTKCVDEFFEYCYENDVKPIKPLLCVWLNVSKVQYWEWEKFPDKYGYKSNIVKWANSIMESVLQLRSEKYPTGNIFLLKTSHGHVETSKVDVTTNGNQISTAEIQDTIGKLGFDK